MLTVQDQITIFSAYLGQQIWIEDYYERQNEPKHRFGKLAGLQDNALLIEFSNGNRLLYLVTDRDPCFHFRLLLKPCSRLTPEIMETANALPVKNFIVPYYRSLGFDLPVFLAPDHEANCMNVVALGLADYRSEQEILADQPVLLEKEVFDEW